MSFGLIPFDDAKVRSFLISYKHLINKVIPILIYVNAGVSIFCQHPHFCYL